MECRKLFANSVIAVVIIIDLITTDGVTATQVCQSGYTMDETTGSCRDIDECTELRDGAGVRLRLCNGLHAECVNLPGEYRCLCLPGFTGDPLQACTRVQIECRSQNNCPANFKCVTGGQITGTCQCLAPFVQEGIQCKFPCDFHTCGQRATCELSGNGPTCVCIPGTFGDPDYACHDINECTANLREDPKGPCSLGATCINGLGAYQCVCQPGTIGDPYRGGCRGAFGCSSDQQCPRQAVCNAMRGACVDPCSFAQCGLNAECFGEDHKVACKCKPGFIGTHDEGCKSPCASVFCGINAHCIVNSYNKATCTCMKGFSGNPWAGGVCRPVGCSTHRPCGYSQVCIQGTCVGSCPGVKCGIGAQCDAKYGVCACPPHFIGNPSYLCVPPILEPFCKPYGCGVNAHCRLGDPNQCQCNPGFTGDPYSACVPAIM